MDHAQIAATLVTVGMCMAGLALLTQDPFDMLDALIVITAAERVLAAA